MAGSTWRRSKSRPSRRRTWMPSHSWACWIESRPESRPGLPRSAGGREFVRVANDYLFGDLGFRGNEIDYNDPRNSCLNYVLDRRTGIPIALSVVYIEVARRLGRPVAGVGLPGHFIVQYDDGEFATYIDPFHSGQLLSQEDCRQLARDRTGSDADATALAPVGTRYILVRMLEQSALGLFSRQPIRQDGGGDRSAD